MPDRPSRMLVIETDRLVIRPVEAGEIGEFQAIAARREIAENLASIPHPLSPADARAWLADRAFRGEPDFVAGIFTRDDVLAGCIGISSDPVTIYYFLASEHWGRGYATEVLNPFLDWCVREFDLDEIKVGVLDDNVGSQRVLEKSGFRNTHATLFQPPFRSEPDRLLMYWKGYGAPEPLATRTNFLYLHPIHPGHASRLAELCEASEDFRLLGAVDASFGPRSAAQWIAESLGRSDIHRLAITRQDGYLTGACEIRADGDVAVIGVWLGSDYRDREYADDAMRGLVGLIFDRMPAVGKVVCRVTRDDPVARDMLQAIGFEDLPGESSAAATTGGLSRLTRARFGKSNHSGAR